MITHCSKYYTFPHFINEETEAILNLTVAKFLIMDSFAYRKIHILNP